ncbi:hypothetical protein [Cohnella abietis]|uniref:Uncharacterized protein n=1 Tax=Cohnella abietis TaxID=2507935 RepID=A0A3T1DBI8_9BACL|nr:hypothetical protein [Cohnella abietis]BBI35496.1 hypothetical protein KCTCHS21_48950 [Cohnella abietis]
MSTKKKVLTLGGVFILGVLGGSVLMYNDSIYHSVNDALGKGATQNAVGGVTSIDISSMDIETALMAVQSERAKLLEAQLKDQIASVQQKNDQIAKLNSALEAVRNQLGQIPSDSPAGKVITVSTELKTALADAGISAVPQTKEDLERLQQQIAGQISASSNSQQMDMLRIQSLSNKRNEAFDVMTNFVKKMQDSRNSIIGNMR